MDPTNKEHLIHRSLFESTLSNYGLLFVRIASAIFVTRLLFLHFSHEEYGFWALCWSIFGYSVLLDFGFGVTIQKSTSQALISKNWDKYNEILSTVFFNYCKLSGLIIFLALFLTYYLDNIFNFSEGSDIRYYQETLLIFGIGSALVFPLGFFSEILRGAQKIPTRNFITILNLVITFIGIYVILSLGYKLRTLALFSILVAIATNLAMFYYSKKNLPELRISFSHYNPAVVKEVLKFSLFAYLITFSNIIIFRTDQIVIAIFGAISLGGFYQIATRFAEMYMQLTKQILDGLGPAVAVLSTNNEKEKINRLLRNANRYGVYIANFIFIPSILYLKPFIKIWLHLTEPTVIISAIILLTSMYILAVYRTFTVQVFLMINKEGQLAKVAMVECIANLVLSILFLHFFGIIGIALGMLIPNIILAIVYNIPQAASYAEISIWKYLWEVSLKTQLLTLVSGLIAYALYITYYPETIFLMILQGSIFAIVYWSLIYFFSINVKERRVLYSFVVRQRA